MNLNEHTQFSMNNTCVSTVSVFFGRHQNFSPREFMMGLKLQIYSANPTLQSEGVEFERHGHSSGREQPLSALLD